MLEEIRDILSIEYGKDVGGIIMGFMYPRCECCKKLFTDENTFETFNDMHVCMYCYTKYLYKKCYNCSRMYRQGENAFCRSCMSPCRVYCSICLDKEYKRGFTAQNEISNLLDEMIHNVLS